MQNVQNSRQQGRSKRSTEAYSLWYVAGGERGENARGGCFQRSA